MDTTASDHSAKPKVLITGCSGLIGSQLIKRLRDEYTLIGFDVERVGGGLEKDLGWIPCDMTSDDGVAQAVEELRERYGDVLASVIHLAAYYDFSGEPSPLYRELTVNGTRRLLRQLKPCQVDQFIFSSTLLVMESSEDDEPITEDSAMDAEWNYPKSKLAAEKVIAQQADIPAVILRIAGVYDEDCNSLPLSQHIGRIYEKQTESYFFPGDKQHGQAFIHLEDLTECFRQTVVHRHELGRYEVFLVGEEDVMSYAELQEELGTLIHGKEWPTIRIPKAVAKAGAWVQEKAAKDEEEQPFIKPWMIDLADQNYPVNVRKARQQLDWEPNHTLRETLPDMIGRFYHNTRRWYEMNKLPLPEELKKREAPTK